MGFGLQQPRHGGWGNRRYAESGVLHGNLKKNFL
jgi:hypothetical protein